MKYSVEQKAPLHFLWRAGSAFFRRSAKLMERASNEMYGWSLPRHSDATKELLRSNERFRDCHRGQRCFVIGNGVSLRKQDLSHLAPELTFVLNAFWKHEIVEEWQPTYYLFSDPILFERSDSVREFFSSLNARIKRTTFFAPIVAKQVIEDEHLLPEDSVNYIAFKAIAKNVLGPADVDLTKPLQPSETIAQTAIMAAIYMGCSPIYLMGLDHDWLAKRGMEEFNFYKGKTLQNNPKVTGGTTCSYDSDLADVLKMWKLYRLIDQFAATRGIKIYNATAGGFLDVYERVDYEALFDSVPQNVPAGMVK